VPWGRPRFRIVSPPGAKPFLQGYTVKEVAAFKVAIQKLVLLAHAERTDGPVAVTMCFNLERPKTVTEKRLLPWTKPDLDNLAKAVLDACNGILWEDDARICDLILRKRYSPAGTWGSIQIHVEAMGDTHTELALTEG
ncbi:MAG: RusA family crossover junction endodeoxyribonuclease, partial [Lysobacterales bacterium]